MNERFSEYYKNDFADGGINMPYITQEKRKDLDGVIKVSHDPANAGELNYNITKLVHTYILENPNKLNYDIINEVIGVLECAKLEMYRMIAGPYEDKKKNLNGNISELDE